MGGLGGFALPVCAVVNPTHLLARLQQVEDPRRVAALFLHLGVAAFGLRLDLGVYVQSLFVRGVHALTKTCGECVNASRLEPTD